MEKIPLPRASDDVRDLWKIVYKLAVAVNALARLRVFFTGKIKFDWTGLGATLQLPKFGLGSAAAELDPWEIYPATYLGTGTPPEDQGRRFRLNPSIVSDARGDVDPANRNAEFLAPPNCTDGFEVWLQSNLDAQGNQTSCVIATGTVQPRTAAATPGNLPPVTYRRLGTVFTDATSITKIRMHADTPLRIVVRIIDQSVLGVTRAPFWEPPGSNFVGT